MLTARGWWFILWSGAFLFLGILSSFVPLALLGLTLVLWFLVEWLLFAYRVQSTVDRLHLEREVRDEHGRVDNLWAGRSFDVSVEFRDLPSLPCGGRSHSL
jgi:hypothetical protein